MRRWLVTLDEVADADRLRRALLRVCRGKRQRAEIRAWLADAPARLDALGQAIRTGTLLLGRSRRHQIQDPKPRIIHAPAVAERILHQALDELIAPVFDRAQVAWSCAGRPGLGLSRALAIARRQTRAGRWHLHLDIRQYFASIPHVGLHRLIERRLVGDEVLNLLWRIIDAHHDAPGRGLPIGTLVSQTLANAYLADSDRLLDQQPLRGRLRYMDDYVLWADDPATLVAARTALIPQLADRGLQLKHLAQPQPCSQGLSVLGWTIRPTGMHLRRSARRRQRRARAQIASEQHSGRLTEAAAARRLQALAAWADPAHHLPDRKEHP
ncbi:MAG: reverse transcriptase domain-containing protein [Planctomycetota bacterium]